MDWDQYREVNGNIDLLRAFNDMTCENNKLTSIADGYRYIVDILAIHPISSRQLSAVILVDALRLSK